MHRLILFLISYSKSYRPREGYELHLCPPTLPHPTFLRYRPREGYELHPGDNSRKKHEKECYRPREGYELHLKYNDILDYIEALLSSP